MELITVKLLLPNPHFYWKGLEHITMQLNPTQRKQMKSWIKCSLLARFFNAYAMMKGKLTTTSGKSLRMSACRSFSCFAELPMLVTWPLVSISLQRLSHVRHVSLSIPCSSASNAKNFQTARLLFSSYSTFTPDHFFFSLSLTSPLCCRCFAQLRSLINVAQFNRFTFPLWWCHWYDPGEFHLAQKRYSSLFMPVFVQHVWHCPCSCLVPVVEVPQALYNQAPLVLGTQQPSDVLWSWWIPPAVPGAASGCRPLSAVHAADYSPVWWAVG